MSKFDEVLKTLEAYCASNPQYKVTPDESKKVLTVEGGPKPVTVTVKSEKQVEWSDPEFGRKVFDFQVDETSDGGFLAIPIDEDSKKDISTLIGEVANGRFSGLKVETVRDYLCPKATTQEFLNFLMEASVLGVNPFTKEIYFIKDKNGKVRHVVGLNAFTRRAAQNPTISHYVAGIIVGKKDDEALVRKEGEFLAPGEVLHGGWCKVYFKDGRPEITAEVSLAEYDPGNQTTGPWGTKKATMICKVAKVHGLRQADPIELNGMYIPEEMGIRADPAKEIPGEGVIIE